MKAPPSQHLPEHLQHVVTSTPVNGITATVIREPTAVDGLYAVLADDGNDTPGPHLARVTVHLHLVKSTFFSDGPTDGEKLVASIAQFLTELFRRKVVNVYVSRELSERLGISHESGRHSPVTDNDKFFFVYGESYQRLKIT